MLWSLGYPAQPHGLNTEGLKRRGFSADSISLLRKAYKTLYRQGLTLAEGHADLQAEAGNRTRRCRCW